MKKNFYIPLLFTCLAFSCANTKEESKQDVYSSGINKNLVFESFDNFPLNENIKIDKKGATTKNGFYYIDSIYAKLNNSKGSLASVLEPVKERRVQRAEIAMDIDEFYYYNNAFIAFDFLVPDSYKVDEDNLGRETMVFQIHSKPTADQDWDYYRKFMPFNRPSIAIYLGKNEHTYYLSLRYGLNGDNDKEYKSYKWFLAGYKEIEAKTWYTIKLNFELSDNNTGFIQAWINGDDFTPFNGKHNKVYGANMHNDALPYLKLGLYRPWPDSHKHEVYFDNLIFGKKIEHILNKNELQTYIEVNKNKKKIPLHL